MLIGVCGPSLSSPLTTDGSITGCTVVDFDALYFLGNATDKVMPTHCHRHTPPECDAGRVTSNFDVWSLGYVILAHRGQLAPEDLAELKSSQEGSARTLAALRSSPSYKHLSQAEWDFIQRCLTYDWKERPTAAMLTEDDYIVKGVPK